MGVPGVAVDAEDKEPFLQARQAVQLARLQRKLRGLACTCESTYCPSMKST